MILQYVYILEFFDFLPFIGQSDFIYTHFQAANVSQAYQITDQLGDAILGCLRDRPIRCRVSFDIKLGNFKKRKDVLISFNS